MLQPKSYTSDLDDLHKSQWTRDLGLVPTRYSCRVSQEEGAVLNCPIEGNSCNGLVLGQHKREYKNLNLKSEYLQGTTYILVR